MSDVIGLNQCRAYIDCELSPVPKAAPRKLPPLRQRPAITLSRETGSGAHSVAERLATYLQEHGPKDTLPWTVFDRNLVEKVLEDHHLPKRLESYMPEDRVSMLNDTLEELLGLHPPTWTLVRQVTQTVLHLAQRGNVILVGRGAPVITAKLPHVFHVRLVSPIERRIERVRQLRQISAKAAAALIAKEDKGRRRYLRKNFGADIDDVLLYDLVINTGRVSYDEAAEMIATAVLHREVRPEA